jgi:hypothetical protein
MVPELARPYARAIAGTVVSTSFDAETRRFSLRYTPAGTAPTEIVVPLAGEAYTVGARNACIDTEATLLVQATGSADVELVLEVSSRVD